jgi:hypothetical protein
MDISFADGVFMRHGSVMCVATPLAADVGPAQRVPLGRQDSRGRTWPASHDDEPA